MSDETSALKRLKQDLDELKLQAKLGKAEAVDFMEEKKRELDRFIDETKRQLEDAADPAREKTREIRQALDELKLKLELGRMESRDAYLDQKKKIESALGTAWNRFDEVEESSGKAIAKSRKSFARRAAVFGAKLELLALKLSAREEMSDEEMERRHAEARRNLEEWIGYLEGAAGEAKSESRASWESLKEKIRKSF